MSYVLNTLYTFTGRFGVRTLLRFLVSTSAGYAAGMVCVIAGARFELPYLAGAAAGLIVAPVVNFVMHARFTYWARAGLRPDRQAEAL